MSKIPFLQQRLRRSAHDAIEFLKQERALGHALRSEDLLEAVVLSVGPDLAPDLRELFPEFSAPERKRRGRPRPTPTKRAIHDFAMEKLDRLYPRLLRRARNAGRSEPKADHVSPSERVYQMLAARWKEFRNINSRALRNQHSRWKQGHFHSVNDCVDSEDFEAEIDRQFPPPKRS
jgi:hypothetical protein